MNDTTKTRPLPGEAERAEGAAIASSNAAAINTLWPDPTEPPPNDEQLAEWAFFDSTAGATDGCTVESDGVCEHGHPSWLIHLGFI